MLACINEGFDIPQIQGSKWLRSCCTEIRVYQDRRNRHFPPLGPRIPIGLDLRGTRTESCGASIRGFPAG